MNPIPLARSLPVLGRFVPALYRLSMQTGLRALWNRARALALGRHELAAALHGVTLEIPGLGPMRLSVHARPTPKGEVSARRFSIISARQLNCKSHRLAYAYLLCTSHFGSGHLELGSFEENGHLTFFGVRNIALANASRFANRWIDSQQLGTAEGTTTEFARACQLICADKGLLAQWAPPSECVKLSVRPELIPPANRILIQRHLTARYERLHVELRPKHR
ncbi:MAG: hypothetical protein ACI87O_000692 [Planctomycetota bacterium]